MTSIFDKWTDLDPALALRRIEAAHGSSIFDNYAFLDPQRALIQIEDAFDIELDDVYGLGGLYVEQEFTITVTA